MNVIPHLGAGLVLLGLAVLLWKFDYPDFLGYGVLFGAVFVFILAIIAAIYDIRYIMGKNVREED